MNRINIVFTIGGALLFLCLSAVFSAESVHSVTPIGMYNNTNNSTHFEITNMSLIDQAGGLFASSPAVIGFISHN